MSSLSLNWHLVKFYGSKIPVTLLETLLAISGNNAHFILRSETAMRLMTDSCVYFKISKLIILFKQFQPR